MGDEGVGKRVGNVEEGRGGGGGCRRRKVGAVKGRWMLGRRDKQGRQVGELGSWMWRRGAL